MVTKLEASNSWPIFLYPVVAQALQNTSKNRRKDLNIMKNYTIPYIKIQTK
jgi:hypothetical protein